MPIARALSLLAVLRGSSLGIFISAEHHTLDAVDDDRVYAIDTELSGSAEDVLQRARAQAPAVRGRRPVRRGDARRVRRCH